MGLVSMDEVIVKSPIFRYIMLRFFWLAVTSTIAAYIISYEKGRVGDLNRGVLETLKSGRSALVTITSMVFVLAALTFLAGSYKRTRGNNTIPATLTMVGTSLVMAIPITYIGDAFWLNVFGSLETTTTEWLVRLLVGIPLVMVSIFTMRIIVKKRLDELMN